MDSWRVKPWLIVAIVAAAAFLPAITGGWIYDDNPLIAENPYIHSLGWWPRWFTSDFWDVNEEIVRFGSRMVYWRPIVTASYAVDWQLGGGEPLVFHISNTLYQAIVGALAYVVLRRWINATLPALAAAILFAIHPTKAESVAWIAGRTDVMCMIGVLIASEGIARRLRGERHGLLLEAAGTLLAYTTKEQAIVLPAFAAVEAWVHADRPPIDLRVIRRMIWVALPQAAISIGYLAIRGIVMPIKAANSTPSLHLGDHVQSVFESMGRFFTLTFAPHELSIQQGIVHYMDGRPLHSTPYVVIGAIAMVIVLALAFLARKRWPVATVGIGFFLITIAPTSNLKYTEMRTLVSERFLYLPVLGFALIVGAALAMVGREHVRRVYPLVGAIALALAMMSLSRSVDFAHESRFWEREQSLHWDSREALSFKISEAIEHKRLNAALQFMLEKSKIINSYDRVDADDLGLAYEVAATLSHITPDRDAATLGAIDQFATSLLEPKGATADLVTKRLQLAIPVASPSYPKKLRLFRARLLALRADINSRLGNDAEALALILKARSVCRTCASVFVVDAIVHARTGRYDEAFAVLADVEDEVQGPPVLAVREKLDKAVEANRTAARATGPAQLQARASELAALELWGRAYQVLAPYKDEIKMAPRFAPGFAELAFRAGDSAVAREVIAPYVDAHQLDDQLNEWAKAMGWAE